MKQITLTTEQIETIRDYVDWWSGCHDEDSTTSHEFEFENGLCVYLGMAYGSVELQFSIDWDEPVEVTDHARLEAALTKMIRETRERAEIIYRDILGTQAVLDLIYR